MLSPFGILEKKISLKIEKWIFSEINLTKFKN